VTCTYLCAIVAPPLVFTTTDCLFRPSFCSRVLLLYCLSLVFGIVRVHAPDHRTDLPVSFLPDERGRTYNSSMVTTSTSFTCTTFCSRFATVLDVSSRQIVSVYAYLDLVTCDTTSETDQVVWAIPTFMLVLFAACWTLAISEVCGWGAINIRGYEDNLVDCAQAACNSCTSCSGPQTPGKSKRRPYRLEDQSTSVHPTQSASGLV
jgi:hypothetical protein